MTELDTDRLIRKEVSLGQIREIPPPNGHIGLAQIAPFKEIDSDDFFFQYITPEVDGLAPARAEDAEAEMAAKDDFVGHGRASIIDWAIKDSYTASDVSRYREFKRIAEIAGVNPQSFPLVAGSMTEDFAAKIARDTLLRRRKLDTRIEWLIMKGAFEGAISYNDGKVKFDVSYGRPGGQQDQAPAGGVWGATSSDPIGDINAMNDYMFTNHGVRLTRAYASGKAIRSIMASEKFAARSGLTTVPTGTPVDPNYLISGWGVDAAVAVVEAATGVKFTVYDGFYRSRALGSNTVVMNRFTDEKKILFLPPEEICNEISPELGFGSTCTSPHPEGNWGKGFYEWERTTVDPWRHDMGAGIKAFPIFPALEYSYVMKVFT